MPTCHILETDHGHRYRVHENGNIERLDGANGSGSSSWKVLGIDHVQRRMFIRFPECFADREWTYKNGRGMWCIRDLDHGSVRNWGDRIHRVYKDILVVGKT